MRITNSFVFFWKADDFPSLWYKSSFESHGITFKTLEHWLAFQKVVLFKYPNYDQSRVLNLMDEDKLTSEQKLILPRGILNKIVAAKTVPCVRKILGELSNVNDDIWRARLPQFYFIGNKLKYEQNLALKEKLLSFGSRTFVESYPFDIVSSNGLTSNHGNAENPNKWPGKNLLGYAITRYRDECLQNWEKQL